MPSLCFLSPNKPSDQSRVTTYSGIDEGGFPPSAQLATLFWRCPLISFAHLRAPILFGDGDFWPELKGWNRDRSPMNGRLNHLVSDLFPSLDFLGGHQTWPGLRYLLEEIYTLCIWLMAAWKLEAVLKKNVRMSKLSGWFMHKRRVQKASLRSTPRNPRMQSSQGKV